MKILNIKSENNPITKQILQLNVKVIYRNYFLEYILFMRIGDGSTSTLFIYALWCTRCTHHRLFP